MKNDILYNDQNSQKICEIKTHFELFILKYNEYDSTKFILINSIQSRHFDRAIL